jgi:hypothetical protein
MRGIQGIGLVLFLVGMLVFTALPFLSSYRLTEAMVQDQVKETHRKKLAELLQPMYGQVYPSPHAFLSAYSSNFDPYNDELKANQAWDQVIWDDYGFALAKASGEGPARSNPWTSLALSIGLVVLGGVLFQFAGSGSVHTSLAHTGVFHSSLKNRGVLGMLTGTYLIGFYVVLYWFPAYLAPLVWMVEPIAQFLSGGPASQWFLYGLVYTLAIGVMGIRMVLKYRDNKYQQLRTASVVFFQTAFAFLIPEVLVLLNKPYFDFKNIWPLDYDFFYDYQIDTFLSSGGVGLFMLIWGILLIVIGVPVFTYFYGKRWYCSWVCGCGGLAETVGDGFRHLSDKSLKAWQWERWMIHGVLALAVGTGGVGNGIIGEFGIEHAKTVVVFGSEHHVLHTGIFSGFGPTRGVELSRIESTLQVLIRLDIFKIVSGVRPTARAPIFVFGANAPTFYDAPLAVGSPVHE